MAFQEFPLSNKAYTIISVGINASDTSLSVAGGNLSLFPAVATDGEFNAVIWNGTDYASPLTDPDSEYVTVTANAASPWTIQRPAAGNDYNNEGSDNIAATHNTASKTYYIALAPSAGLFNKLKGMRSHITVGPAGSLADYVCDGTADDVEIQAAINKANVSSLYRGVIILGGTYDITATIQKYQVAVKGIGEDATILEWSGAGSSIIFTTGNAEGGYLGLMTIDGGAKGDGNIGFTPNANIDRFIFERVIFKDCGTGIDQDGGASKQMWDSASYDCQFTGCSIGILFSEFQFIQYNPLIDTCDVGIKLETNSNARILGGTFTQNGTDIYIDNHCSGVYLNNVWLEESTSHILNANSARTNWVKNIVFDSCHLSTADLVTFIDCTYIKGLVEFRGGYMVETAGPTSTTVTAGADSVISYQGCQHIDIVGSVTWPGSWQVQNTLAVDTISEFTAANGVVIDGMTCKDGSLAYTGTITLASTTGVTNLLTGSVNAELRIFGSGGSNRATILHNDTDAIFSTTSGDIYLNPAGGNVVCQTALNVDVIGEVTGTVGVTCDGVQLVDDQIRSLSLKSGATQVAAGAAAGELWQTASHATQEDNTVMVGV